MLTLLPTSLVVSPGSPSMITHALCSAWRTAVVVALAAGWAPGAFASGGAVPSDWIRLTGTSVQGYGVEVTADVDVTFTLFGSDAASVTFTIEPVGGGVRQLSWSSAG
jgi:hypothetical protein